MEKVYVGVRTPEGCEVFVERKGKRRRLRHIVRHSPTGFEWGYGGSGPADTALSILVDHFNEKLTQDDIRHGRGRAFRYYQRFKWDVIAVAPYAGFKITTQEINEWLSSRPDQTGYDL